MLDCVLNTPQNCTLNLKNTPGKIHQCMCGDFFSKFKVFMSVSVFLYFHFVKYESNKSISAVESRCSFFKIVKNVFSKTSLWLYEFFLNLLGCVHFPVVKCWYCVVPPTQKGILQLHINKNE